MSVLPNAIFVSVAGYHHHLAYNTWRGTGIPGAPRDGVVGLRHWTILVDGAAAVTAARERLAVAGVTVVERDGGILVHDPAGIPVLIAPDAR